MAYSSSAPIIIDLDQFKLHLNIQGIRQLSLHFDTPSRRFYLSVIALVVEQMRKSDNIRSVPLEDHAGVLALLNETVGGSAGSSETEKLLPRIYRKWKDALPDLENASLFKVIGTKKGYDDASGKIYRFDTKTKDAWANLFEYRGSRQKVRLRFSVERLGIRPEDVVVAYGNESDTHESRAWDRFIECLRTDVKAGVLTDGGKDVERDAVPMSTPEEIPTVGKGNAQGIDLESNQSPQPAENLAEKKEQDALHRPQRKKRWLAYGSAVVIILGLITLFGVRQYKAYQRQAVEQSAYEIALPKIRQLLEDEKYVAAHALARETEKIIPHDPTLQQYIKKATNTFDIETMPAGARVSYRPYSDVKGPWMELGVTPIKNVVVSVGMNRFRIQMEGYGERELLRAVVPRGSLGYVKFREISDPFQFILYEKGRVPAEMVPVDGGAFKVPIKGVPNKVFTVDGPFFIDRFEVTNRAYKEFVDAGGYGDPRYWKEEFKKDGQVIPFAEAMKAFVDRTGRPGPSTWELGDYPEERDDYPVTGISWYEAAAYARFRGKTLPTIYHWARALFPKNEFFTPLTPHLIPQSNIERKAVAPVGSYPGIGSSGAKDMAGNVREWCWNAAGENRYCLGGWWRDPAYVVTDSCVASAWDRSQGNGVRCVLYPEDARPTAAHLKPADLRFHDPYTIPPRSKESLETLKTMFAYEKGPLHPVVESRKAGGKGWIRETVTIDAAYGGERLIIHLDLPDHCKPPYKAVIYWPGASAFYHTKFSRNFLWEPWDLIPENGRALISPIYSNCFERGGGKPVVGKKSRIQRQFDRLNDLRRTIDYLETRKDIDTRSLAFLGLCWGGLVGPKISPYEERIKTLILVSGGIYIPIAYSKPKALTQAMTKVPVLMLNGKYDFIFPVKTHQKPLFDLIATPPEHKKYVIYNTGHLPLPRAPMMKEIFAWLDKYQGHVNCEGDTKADDQN